MVWAGPILSAVLLQKPPWPTQAPVCPFSGLDPAAGCLGDSLNWIRMASTLQTTVPEPFPQGGRVPEFLCPLCTHEVGPREKLSDRPMDDISRGSAGLPGQISARFPG